MATAIKYWQVGNEPSVLQLEGFAELQRITYTAIKDACADCYVLIGGNAGMPPVNKYISHFNAHYRPILEELNGSYVDIMDFHWYGDATGDYRDTKVIYNYIRSVLNAEGFSNIPIWITEMGSYSGDPSVGVYNPIDWPPQTERQQASDYLKRFVYSLSIGVEKIFPAFGLIEGFKNNDGYFDHTGLIYDGWGPGDLGLGVKKLGYYTYKKMTEVLEGSDWNTVQTIRESENVYILKFVKHGSPIYLAWWDYFDEAGYVEGDTKTVVLTVDFAGEASVINAVPAADSGADLNENDYPNFFETKTTPVINNTVTLTLGESPVFVEMSE